ncbi:MAG: hypothetical protein Fur003_3370 [Candidatus Dojkabacteria bacterium]
MASNGLCVPRLRKITAKIRIAIIARKSARSRFFFIIEFKKLITSISRDIKLIPIPEIR